jgi:hypothetical protein
MKVEGPCGFERMYTLTGSTAEHQPEAIRSVLAKLLFGNPKISDRGAWHLVDS